MPVRTTWEAHGIRWEFYGQVAGEEIDRVNNEFLQDPRSEQAKYQIIDARGVTGTDWNARDAHLIAARDFRATRMVRRLRLAFLTTDPDFGALVDEYVAISRDLDTSWEFRRFDDMPSARAWVEED